MLDITVKPDADALVRNLRREGTPRRVHIMELFLDGEIHAAIDRRFGLADGLDPADPRHGDRLHIRRQRFLGYDYALCAVENFDFPRWHLKAADSVIGETTRGERSWTDEHTGPIRDWETFEKYPWPDPKKFATQQIEWMSANLPDDMCLVSRCHSIFEQVTWLLGYETLCYKLHDDPALVDAMFERIGGLFHEACKLLCQFDRVRILHGGDDMGFKTATMIPPKVLIEKSFPWHKKNADLAHQHGKLYVLHACGNLEAVMPALIEDVGIDGKHSFEDVIEPVTVAKRRWGGRIALIGGIDVDFLCRADEAAVRRRVRETLDICLPGGGYCLGSGNSVTNYIPLQSYLAMIDEGRRYATA